MTPKKVQKPAPKKQVAKKHKSKIIVTQVLTFVPTEPMLDSEYKRELAEVKAEVLEAYIQEKENWCNDIKAGTLKIQIQ